MYKVLIVDDEPPFVRQITALLARTGRFEAVSFAYNGKQALDELEKHTVHLLIADVRMPIINGIELIEQAIERYPGLICVIISGFADFEYAQGAIKAGASDFIVKPIDPKQFDAMMTEIASRLDADMEKKRRELIEKLLSGKNIDDAEAQSLLGVSEFEGSAILFGLYGNTPYLYTDNVDYSRKMNFLNETFKMIYGNGNFILYSIGPHLWYTLLLVSGSQLKKDLVEKLDTWPDNISIVFTATSTSLNLMGSQLRHILKTLQNNARICGSCCVSDIVEGTVLDEDQLQLFVKSLQVCSYEVFLVNFDSMVKEWKRLCIRQVETASALRQIAQVLQRRFGAKLGYDIAQEFENAINEITSFREICELIRSLAAEGFTERRQTINNSLRLFSEIEQYIDSNITSTITLTDACKAFHVSQPLLSRTVRHHTGRSFNEYVTAKRMERAKILMIEQQSLMIRDVAESLGFMDQHYFSRLFKALFACTPTEYRNRNMNN